MKSERGNRLIGIDFLLPDGTFLHRLIKVKRARKLHNLIKSELNGSSPDEIKSIKIQLTDTDGAIYELTVCDVWVDIEETRTTPKLFFTES
ncbi:hypothetical protein HY045_00440 [Candidatus Woesebacteria bacterium]|nr:hypothetical protein [Candidatus Woesebacteria bacterium]